MSSGGGVEGISFPFLGPSVASRLNILMAEEGYSTYDGVVTMLIDFYNTSKSKAKAKKTRAGKTASVSLFRDSGASEPSQAFPGIETKTDPKVISSKSPRKTNPRLRSVSPRKTWGGKKEDIGSSPSSSGSSPLSGSHSRIKTLGNRGSGKKLRDSLIKGKSWNKISESSKHDVDPTQRTSDSPVDEKTMRSWESKMDHLEESSPVMRRADTLDTETETEDDIVFLDKSQSSIEFLAASASASQSADRSARKNPDEASVLDSLYDVDLESEGEESGLMFIGDDSEFAEMDSNTLVLGEDSAFEEVSFGVETDRVIK